MLYTSLKSPPDRPLTCIIQNESREASYRSDWA